MSPMRQRERLRRAKRLRLNILSVYDTITDAVEAFGIGRATLYRYLKKGEIPYKQQVWISSRGVPIEKILEGL